MLVSTLFISLLALALAVAAAASPQPADHQFARRQVSVGAPSPMPSQCTSICSPVNNEVSLGCPVTACCTTTFETQYYNCLVCVGTALDAANYTAAQNSLNLLYTTCVDMGFVLPRLELPGQSNSTSNATSTASVLLPTGSSGSSSTTPATGAAVGERWPGERVGALIGAAVILGIAGLW